MNIKQKKNDNDIKISSLIYKPSMEANFRLSKALSMLLSEKDILDYFNNSNNFKNKCQQKKK